MNLDEILQKLELDDLDYLKLDDLEKTDDPKIKELQNFYKKHFGFSPKK